MRVPHGVSEGTAPVDYRRRLLCNIGVSCERGEDLYVWKDDPPGLKPGKGAGSGTTIIPPQD